MNRERLLNVARALRESKNPEQFDMAKYGYGCGTPACALGHYAHRSDLQNAFTLVDAVSRLCPEGDADIRINNQGDRNWNRFVERHFGISEEESEEIFGVEGCGDAKTVIEAAEYIERFVATQAQS